MAEINLKIAEAELEEVYKLVDDLGTTVGMTAKYLTTDEGKEALDFANHLKTADGKAAIKLAEKLATPIGKLAIQLQERERKRAASRSPNPSPPPSPQRKNPATHIPKNSKVECCDTAPPFAPTKRTLRSNDEKLMGILKKPAVHFNKPADEGSVSSKQPA